MTFISNQSFPRHLGLIFLLRLQCILGL